MANDRLRLAHLLALILPLALIVGAWGFQLIGGLIPCEMCHWQRWPHYTAIVIALVAFAVPARQLRMTLVALATLAILTSGLIGVYHAGVEYHWWAGITACSNSLGSGSLADIMAAPVIACDRAQWTMFGISMAGYNAIISIIGAGVIFSILMKAGKRAV